MDILTLKKDLPAIEDGRWVDKEELPALQEVRLKVRSYNSKYVQDRDQARKRDVKPEEMDGEKLKPEVLNRLGLAMLQDVLVDVENLTMGDQKLDIDQVRVLIVDVAYEPFSALILQASRIVHNSRVARKKEISGN